MYQSQIISYLLDLLEEVSGKGFQYPMIAVVVSADGSVLVMKWRTLNDKPDFESKATKVAGPMKAPIKRHAGRTTRSAASTSPAPAQCRVIARAISCQRAFRADTKDNRRNRRW
jgi:hypothetical protein